MIQYYDSAARWVRRGGLLLGLAVAAMALPSFVHGADITEERPPSSEKSHREEVRDQEKRRGDEKSDLEQESRARAAGEKADAPASASPSAKTPSPDQDHDAAEKDKPPSRTASSTEPGKARSKEGTSAKANYPSPEVWPWGEPYEITTPDGMILRGMYKAPREAKPPLESKSTVVVFVDGGLNDFVTSFRSITARLTAKGYGVLAYDARGSGISKSRTDGSTYDLAPDSMKPEPYKKMIEDLKLIVKDLRDSKGIRPAHVVLCGTSIGANIAIMAGAEMPMDVRSVIAISAGSNYRGIRPLDAAKNLGGRPLLALCAGQDAFAYTLLLQLKRGVPNAKTFIVKGGAHGHALLNADVIEKIADWLDAH